MLDIVDGIKTKKFSCVELTKYYLSQIEKYKDKNAVLEVFDDALERAYAVDALVESGADLPELVGVPILIKDNIFYKGKISSSASKMLEHYVAQYSSTVVKRLLKAGVVILGRTNMDEFAMGGSCLILPPVSLPRAKAHISRATATALPPELPPETLASL